MRWLWVALGGLAVATAATSVQADSVPRTGTVTGVTAGELYLDLGADSGLRPGDTVTVLVGGQRISLLVADVSPHAARAGLPATGPLPRVGDPVAASPPERAQSESPAKRRLRTPESSDAMAARWGGVDRGRPRRVVYRADSVAVAEHGEPRASGVQGALALDYLGVLDLGNRPGPHYHRAQLRSRLDVAPASLQWMDYSHRLRLRLDFEPGGPFRYPGARDALLVYRLRAGFTAGGVRAELGRTEAGSFPAAGVVDGASVRYRLLPQLYVGAFGGASPELLDLAPAVDAFRFGIYAALRHVDNGARPLRWSADLGLVASTFDGRLDRRALGARLAVSDRAWWATAQTVVDFYAADHPAARPAADPSMLLVTAGYRWGRRARVTTSFDHVRATRTRQSLATLPDGLMPTVAFRSARTSARFSLTRHVAVDARAGWRWDADEVSTLWYGGGVRLDALWLRDDHLTVRGDGYVGTYQDGVSGYLGYRLPILRRLEVDTGYRLTTYRYGNENQQLFRHSMQLGLDAWITRRTTALLQAEAQVGDELRSVAVFASVAYRF